MAFVDDTDLITEGLNAFQLIQQILDMYNRLYGATGGYVQEDKTTYFAWKWCWKKGEKIIKNLKETLVINK